MLSYRRIELTDDEHNAFVYQFPHSDLMQLTPWADAKAKFGWSSSRVAVGDDAGPQAVAQILYRKMGPFVMAYAPRGPMLAFENRELFEAILKAMADEARDQGAFMLKIDPDIEASDRASLEFLESLGFKHRGWSKEFGHNVQPRFVAVTPLSEETMEEQLQIFPSRTRTNIRRSLKNGLFIEEAPREKLPIFDELMRTTSERDVFAARPLSYFEALYDAFVPYRGEGIDFQCFLVGLDLEEALNQTYKDLKQREREVKRLAQRVERVKEDGEEPSEGQLQQLDQLQRSLEKLEEDRRNFEAAIEEGEKKRYLSGAIYVRSGDHANYLYGASSNKHRDLLPNYFMQWEMMKYAHEQGARFYDFGGISGQDDLPPEEDQAPGLWEFKKRFAAEQLERVGEFEQTYKPVTAWCYHTAMGLRTWLRHRRKSRATQDAAED